MLFLLYDNNCDILIAVSYIIIVIFKPTKKLPKQPSQQYLMLSKQMMNEKLSYILIQTPIRQQLLTNKSFEDVHEKLNQDIKRMYDSNFYEYINIHYGVKSTTLQNLSSKINTRKKQIIQYLIQVQNQHIRNINRAEDEVELAKYQREYEENIVAVKKKQNQFDPSQFIPCIYVEAKMKKPAYGKLFQEFDRKGMAMLKATIGYRAPFSLLDRIEFLMETPPLQYFKKRNYYEFGFNWLNPTAYFGGSTFFTGGSIACGPIFRGVDEKKISSHFGFQKDNIRLEMEATKRYPRLHERIDNYCVRGFHIPSTKLSFKVDKTLADTLDRGEIMTGHLQEAKLQTTVPLISQAQFIKAQYNYRKFYDIFSLGEKLKNEKIKLFIRNSNLETNFSLKAVTLRNNIISDFLENIEVRGFENDRRPSQSVFQVKASVKVNNYNYPFFGGIGIIPFMYGQAGMTMQKDIRKPYVLGSAGVGLSFPLGKSIQLELLYSLFQAQNRPSREPVNFQIRIGLMD